MLLVALDIDGAEGAGGTQILAGSAADATALVDGGDIGRLFVVGVACAKRRFTRIFPQHNEQFP